MDFHTLWIQVKPLSCLLQACSKLLAPSSFVGHADQTKGSVVLMVPCSGQEITLKSEDCRDRQHGGPIQP